MKIDTSALRAAIAEEIKSIDKKGEVCSKQILEEGKIAAYANAHHDTNYMRGDGLDAGSKVERIAPAVFSITLGSIADYAFWQEFDPKRGKPFIRPAVMIMQAKAPEICDRGFNE
jgi:hypothetical protein